MERVDRDFRNVILILLPAMLIGLLAAGLGTCAFGPRGDVSGRAAAFVVQSDISAEDLTFCLRQNWGNRLSLQAVADPKAGPNTTRLHNPVSNIIVDVSDLGSHREIQVYAREDRPLSAKASKAIGDCAASLNKAVAAGFPKS